MRNTTQKYIYGISAILLLFLLLPDTLIAQTPQTFNYQAVLRSGDHTVRKTDNASIQIAIHQGSESGTEVYSELHNVTTNAFGLINLEIGSKFPANFAMIDWSDGPFYLKVFVDGVEMGTSQLLSVPFAMYAASAPQGEKGELGDPGPQGEKGDPGDTKWNDVSGGISYMDGNVGIGTDIPDFKLHIKGPVKIEGNDLILGDPTRGDGGRAMVHWGTGTGSDDKLIFNFDGDFEEGVQVQGNKLLIDGNVGIGTTTPSEKLVVNGNIQVSENYTYSSEKTDYYHVGPSEFHKRESWAYHINQEYGHPTTAGRAMATVHLPNGAIVTEVRVYYVDCSTNNLTVYFRRTSSNGITKVDVGSVSSTENDLYTNPIARQKFFNLNETIDNANNRYTIMFETDQTNNNHRLYNIRIKYKISKL